MLPDPQERPLLKPDELVGALPLRRSAVYAAIERGEIPTLRYGRRLYVINAELQRQLGLHPAPDMREPASTTDAGIAAESATIRKIGSPHDAPHDAA